MRFIPLFIFAALAGVLIFSLASPPKKPEAPEFSAFSLPAIFPTSQVSVSSDALKNKLSIVHFFASWCITCREEQPLLLKLSKQTSIPLIGIAWKDEPKKTIAWLNTLGNPYAIVGSDQGGTAVIAFGCKGVPETFVVDKEGHIVFHHPGMLTEDIVQRRLLPLLDRLPHDS